MGLDRKGLGQRRMPAMDAYRAIVDKRDQRHFLDRPIPDDALRRILRAGRMTGSSKNVEPNRFVVVRDRTGVEALAALSAFARWMAKAAAVVIIVQTQEHQFDAGRCAQNMMLARRGATASARVRRICPRRASPSCSASPTACSSTA